MTAPQTPAPLRIGVLGASRIAESAITDASRETGDVRAAIAARSPERAAEYARTHGYERVHESYDDLIVDESLDLVYIGLPNGLHAEWTAKALAAGRAVLVEKPFASNLAEFDEVLSAVGDAGAPVWEAFHYADHPLMSRLLEIIASEDLGSLEEVRIAMRMPAPDDSDPRWSFDLSGGAMMDLGCYAVNALLLLGETLGRPVSLHTATGEPWRGDARVDAAVEAELWLGSTPVRVDTNMVSDEWDFSFTAIGSRGSVTAPNFVKPQEDDRIIIRVAGDERTEAQGTTSSYVYQLQRIRAALTDPEAARAAQGTLLERSRRTMQLIDEIYTAAGLPLRPGSFSGLTTGTTTTDRTDER